VAGWDEEERRIEELTVSRVVCGWYGGGTRAARILTVNRINPNV